MASLTRSPTAREPATASSKSGKAAAAFPVETRSSPLRIFRGAGDLEGLLVEEDRLAGRAAAARQPAQIVEGRDLAAPVLDCPAQLQGAGQIELGALHLAEGTVGDAEVVERRGFLPAVVQGGEDLPRLAISP